MSTSSSPLQPVRTLRARWVVPVDAPAIPDGAVRIRNARIEAVGSWRELKREPTRAVADLGEVALLPGLVNAHCHLDYTGMAGEVPAGRRFTDWIMGIKAAKDGRTLAEFATAWRTGAEMLLRNGVTAVADAEAFPELLPEVWEATPLRCRSYLELIRVRADLEPAEPVRRAGDIIRGLPDAPLRAGLAPHAPYSTRPELLAACARLARDLVLPVMVHAAESADEIEMFLHRRGALYEWLRDNGRNMDDCDGSSPIARLAKAGLLGPRTLVVHANHLAPGDTALLAASGASVVHCPRSHAFFRHADFPLAGLQAAGIPVCLGTDSLASVAAERGTGVELDLPAEMAWFASRYPAVPPLEILRMATLNGARAMGWSGLAGTMAPGAWADLLAVPSSGTAADALAGFVHGALKPAGTFVGGRRIVGEAPVA